MSGNGLDALHRMIADECIDTDADVEVLRRLLDIYEAVSPLVDATHELTQLEWNGVMSRLRFAVSEFERGGGAK